MLNVDKLLIVAIVDLVDVGPLVFHGCLSF